jgi:hypothetical protein
MKPLLCPSKPAEFEQSSGYRTGFISVLAAGVGVLAGLIAFILYDLIALLSTCGPSRRKIAHPAMTGVVPTPICHRRAP